jgi:hemoglobin
MPPDEPPPPPTAMQAAASRAAARAALVAEIRANTGIDEAMISTLVRTFYSRVRADELLGPVFEERIADWETHFKLLTDFWHGVTLLSGRYSGQPMRAHVRLPVEARHFTRWLELFEATANEVCTPAAAQMFTERARRIAESLQMGIAYTRG